VRHDARQLDAGRTVQHAGNVDQPRQLGIGQAGAAAAAVDLDEDGEGVAVLRGVRDRPGNGKVVRHDTQIHALTPQLGHRRQFGGYDTHGIENVLETALREITRLGEGRDGDSAVVALDRHPANLHGFCGLQMRA